jgi:hypothetical protein
MKTIHHLAMVATKSRGYKEPGLPSDRSDVKPPPRSHRCQAVECYERRPMKTIHHLAMVATKSRGYKVIVPM